MVLTRYQIRNEYALADKELYQAANGDDAEALLEGASMAGLVGILRQLGDLAEFAAEIFHCLHEELKTTAARGYGLTMRLQQLEAELPSIEIPILSQIDHSKFFYEPGLKRHYNLLTEENLISPRNLPHCIMDTYEECRGPPQLCLLDKFDVAGSGSCLKRYSDPSLLKTLTASAVVATLNHNKDERPRKPKLQKKESHTTSGETSGDSRTSHAKLHQLFFLEYIENRDIYPEFHVKLKRRLLNGHPINSSPGRCYMEKFLRNSSPYCERVHKTPDQSCLTIKSEVTLCSVQEDLPILSLVDLNSGDTMKHNEMAMESIPDYERLEVPFTPHEVTINEKSLPQEGRGPTSCLQRSSSVNLCSKANKDADAPCLTESEANKADNDEKTGSQQCLSLGCCIQKQDQGQENSSEMAMESIPDDERLEVLFTPHEFTINENSLPQEDGGPTACLERSSSVNLCSKANKDANAPGSTESEANKADNDEKTGSQQCLSLGCCIQKQDQGQENSSEMAMECIPDDERLEVLFTLHEVTMNEKSLPQVEGGPTTCSERSSSVNLCSKANNDANAPSSTESEANKADSDEKAGIQQWLSLGCCIQKQDQGQENSSEMAMECIPGDERLEVLFTLHEVTMNEKSLPQVEGGPTTCSERSSSVNLCSKANNDANALGSTELEANKADSDEKAGIQQCLSLGRCIHKQDQGQKNSSESGLEKPITVSVESLPTEDGPVEVQGLPFMEVLTCNEKIPPSCITEVEALHPPYQDSLTLLNEHIHRSIVSKDLIKEEDCLDMSPESRIAFSTSIDGTPHADQEITPPLLPLPPTQWWMGKLVELTEGSRVEAASICAQTTLDKPSRATEERSFSAVDGTSDTYMHDDESTLQSLNKTVEASFAGEVSAGGVEGDWRTEAMALKWFSQNLREHTSPHHANLKEESQLGNPLETKLPQTSRGNNSYDQNQKAGNLEKDKGSPVRGIDRSMLRKVSERNMTQVGTRVDEKDLLLEIIRSKSFNLRPTDASGRPNFQVNVPKPNLKVAAILEKANTLRQAMAGSDDEHDSGNWSD